MKNLKSTFFSLLCMSTAFVSCEKDDEAGRTKYNNAFDIRMTDAPANYKALNVKVVKIETYLENNGWVTLNNDARTLNILDLTNGSECYLAQNFDVETGIYSKVKLTFDQEATLEQNINLDTELLELNNKLMLKWGTDKEVIININEEVSAKHKTSLLLDFNVAQSVIENGNDFILKPVITQVEHEQTGIKGIIRSEQRTMIVVEGQGESHSTYTNENGAFVIRGLAEGEYNLQISVSAHGAVESKKHVLENVWISQGEIKSIGSIKF